MELLGGAGVDTLIGTERVTTLDAQDRDRARVVTADLPGNRIFGNDLLAGQAEWL